MTSLFSKEFIQTVSSLRIKARQVAATGRHAEHRSREMGSGIEFRDYRNYMPGDDVRHVDWNLYRRSGRLFLKLFEQVEDLPVYILLDQSESMYFERPPRSDAAKQIAGVLAAAALQQHDRVGIYPFGAEIVAPLPGVSGKMAVRRVLSYLERLGPSGPTHLAQVLRQLRGMRLRPGLLMIVSDFYDRHGIDPVIESLRSISHRLVLVQVVRPSDEMPQLNGEVRLVDCETQHEVDATISPRELEQYRQAYRSFNAKLSDYARLRRAPIVRLNAEESVLDQLTSLFVNGLLEI